MTHLTFDALVLFFTILSRCAITHFYLDRLAFVYFFLWRVSCGFAHWLFLSCLCCIKLIGSWHSVCVILFYCVLVFSVLFFFYFKKLKPRNSSTNTDREKKVTFPLITTISDSTGQPKMSFCGVVSGDCTSYQAINGNRKNGENLSEFPICTEWRCPFVCGYQEIGLLSTLSGTSGELVKKLI